MPMLRNKVLISLFLMSSLFAKEIIAVLDLDQIGLSDQEATILTQRLTTKLISLNKYQVVERNNMDKILKEQKFQHSGCTDSECAVEIGQLLNTDFIILGSVNKFGSTYAVDARLIDVGLGKSLISAEFSMKGEIDILLTTGMTSIAKQLCDLPAQKTAEATQVDIPPVAQIAPKARVIIKSNPLGSQVYLDDAILGSTPFTKSLEHGMYTLLFHKTGYDSLSKNITVEGVEDYDVCRNDFIEANQCKYHEMQNATSSLIRKPLILMLDHYIKKKSEKYKYKLRIYYYYEKTFRNLSLGICNSCRRFLCNDRMV